MTLTEIQREGLRCAFCGKSQQEVRKLIAGPGIYICDVCVGLCSDVIAVESPDTGDKKPIEAARARLTKYLRKLLRGNTSLLVIDIQERLSAAMDPARLALTVKNSSILIETAKTFSLPIYSTEQYPKGLGPTVASIRPELTGDAAPLEKVAFSSMAVNELGERLKKSGREQVVVVGMETHVCVYQTVRDLVAQGYTAFVPRDAVLSRTQENHEVGLELMREAGATITSTETVVFDLLGAAGSLEFKKLSALVK